ncbi:hypothetical protein O7635_31870 [Asanoa sp. WMMD1127]|uniref:hypothetical protein n=1 Tax=Asanoa sp. WMMD1127 TaxID=3016107 RepID=UPI002417FFC9|nr:hypothetical protein [Asanoa sp. WMMD1127]MDG4826472.1 hypothetical protein [Asanoa sp. WMMD1127]
MPVTLGGAAAIGRQGGAVVDGYCERSGPGLWGEPLNALSNVAFLLASAILVGLLVRRPTAPPRIAWVLAGLLGVVGLCSLAFHTFATSATGALDTLSILVYLLVVVGLLLRFGFGVRAGRAWVAAPAFLVLAVGVDVASGGGSQPRRSPGGAARARRLRRRAAFAAAWPRDGRVRRLARPASPVVLALVAVRVRRDAERVRTGEGGFPVSPAG